MAFLRSSRATRLFAGAVVLALPLSVAARAQMLGDGAPPPHVDRGYPSQPPPPQPPPPPPPVSSGPMSGYAPTFDAVMASAFSQTAFTFDRTMLSAADSFFGNGDEETRRVVAGLNSITVKTYRARDYARYDPGALAAIDGQYRAAGWKHLVNQNGRGSASMMDLWLHYSGANINGLTVLNRGDRNMSVISVDCTLRPLDLLHLSGHFGIPKVDENAVMVPAH